MNNAELFKQIFGEYATAIWALPENEFLEWLNADVPDTNVGDTISRQAAIDAVCAVCGNTECNIFDPENKVKVFCPEPYAIMKLPSAEPVIIHCKDCKYYDGRPCGVVDYYNIESDFCSRAERRTDD